MLPLRRFAPMPTGLLHIGSLLTAAASYADARSSGLANGWSAWKTSIRTLPKCRGRQAISCTLEAFGFEWDGEVAYQICVTPCMWLHYAVCKPPDLVYPCYLHPQRAGGGAAAVSGVDGFVYNGRCRNPQQRPACKGKQPAWRIRRPPTATSAFQTASSAVAWLARDIGDFVLLRAGSCLGIPARRRCRRCHAFRADGFTGAPPARRRYTTVCSLPISADRPARFRPANLLRGVGRSLCILCYCEPNTLGEVVRNRRSFMMVKPPRTTLRRVPLLLQSCQASNA